MVEPYSLFEDVAAILSVCAVGWIVTLFISRELAWICSALISGLLFLLLVFSYLAPMPFASPAARLDMVYTTALCLVVHMVSDLALVVIHRRITRVPLVALSEAGQTVKPKGHPVYPRLDPQPSRSLGD
jgi:hypothetical protein